MSRFNHFQEDPWDTSNHGKSYSEHDIERIMNLSRRGMSDMRIAKLMKRGEWAIHVVIMLNTRESVSRASGKRAVNKKKCKKKGKRASNIRKRSNKGCKPKKRISTIKRRRTINKKRCNHKPKSNKKCNTNGRKTAKRRLKSRIMAPLSLVSTNNYDSNEIGCIASDQCKGAAMVNGYHSARVNNGDPKQNKDMVNASCMVNNNQGIPGTYAFAYHSD